MKNTSLSIASKNRTIIHYSKADKGISIYFAFYLNPIQPIEPENDEDWVVINAIDYIAFVGNNLRKGNQTILRRITAGKIIEDTSTQFGKFIQQKTEDLLIDYTPDPYRSFDLTIEKFLRLQQKVNKGIKPHEWFHAISDFADIATQLRLGSVSNVQKYKGLYKADIIYKEDKDFIKQLTVTFIDLLRSRKPEALDFKMTQYLDAFFFKPLSADHHDLVAFDLDFRGLDSEQLYQTLQALRKSEDLSKHWVGIWMPLYSNEGNSNVYQRVTIFFKLSGENIGTIVFFLKRELLSGLDINAAIHLNSMYEFKETLKPVLLASDLIEANSKLIELHLERQNRLDFERGFFIALSLIALSVIILDLKVSDIEEANRFIEHKYVLSPSLRKESKVKKYKREIANSAYLIENQNLIYSAMKNGVSFRKTTPKGPLFHSVNAVNKLIPQLLNVSNDDYNLNLLRDASTIDEIEKAYTYINIFDLICNSLSLPTQLRILTVSAVSQFMRNPA